MFYFSFRVEQYYYAFPRKRPRRVKSKITFSNKHKYSIVDPPQASRPKENRKGGFRSITFVTGKKKKKKTELASAEILLNSHFLWNPLSPSSSRVDGNKASE